MQFGYHTRLQRETERWVEKDIIDSDTAALILSESHSQKTGYSFSSIVAMLGIISLCFAAMTFVAANWDEMPKIVRVGLLLVGMAASYVAAVVTNNRGNNIIADAFVLLGCGIFGAAIMLVGQMYHLQGRAQDAVLLWAAGSFLAALVLRASTALWLAIALFTLWMSFDFMDKSTLKGVEINTLYLVFWLACAGLAWWLHSRMSAHLLLMGIVGWIFMAALILGERHDTTAYMFGLYALWFMVIALAVTSHEQGPYLRGAEAAVVRYMVLCIVGMTATWVVAISPELLGTRRNVELYQNSHILPMGLFLIATLAVLANAKMHNLKSFYDIAFCAIWTGLAIFVLSTWGLKVPYLSEAYALALSIWMIRMGDRQDIPAVTRLGYTAFALTMLFLYFLTASSLLGTAGFYLTAGVLMVVGAIYLPRIFKSGKGEEEAAK